MTNIPLDYAVIGFAGNKFKGKIAEEVYRLVETGMIRVVDLVFISKDADGGYTTAELNDLPEEVYRHFIPFGEHLTPLFTPEDVDGLAQGIPPDCAALLMLWQNTWTENFRRAVENANGTLLMHERIPGDVLDEVMKEIAAAQQ
jgi:hypothetical protein